jgi:cellulose synthase/poly-beta-1,6-N-acetylglucosamine synthase-like glycosyltransferase
MDYSLIITAKDEPGTVANLITKVENQMPRISQNFEILVVCPDEKTKESAISHDKLQLVTWIKDKGKGKPAALSLAFDRAKGNILILTDGDVGLAEGALKGLVKKFGVGAPLVGVRNHRVDTNLQRAGTSPAPTAFGLVTGKPVPTNPRDNIFGYWSHFLTHAAHQQRKSRADRGQYLDASGYLLAIRKELVPLMPEDILVDDAYISHQVWNQGKKIGYAPKAEVRVKFATNLADWVTQKKRTTSGFIQLKAMEITQDKMRGFFEEFKGLSLALTYSQNPKEYFWTILLLIARLYVWLAVFWERKILKKPYSGNWKRIESTK